MSDWLTSLRERLGQIVPSSSPPPRVASSSPRPIGRPRSAIGDPDVLSRRRERDHQRYWEHDERVVWARLQLTRLRRAAKQAGVLFDLTAGELTSLLDEADMIDPALGTPMTFGRGTGPGGVHANVPVCERLDRDGPFHRANLIVISHRTRQVLNSLDRGEVRKLARFVTAIDVADRLKWLNNR